MDTVANQRIRTMHADYSSLGNQAFGEGADRLITVRYRAHLDAVAFLMAALRQPNGIGLLQGSEGSGKTSVARELSTQLERDADLAFVDGDRLKPRELLTSMLSQFGVDHGAEPDDELLRMLNDFAMRQARSWQSPIIVVDGIDKAYSGSLRILTAIADLEVRGKFAVRFVFTGQDGLETLLESNGMTSIARRASSGLHTMAPLTAKEAMIYLHARLKAAGSDLADTLFPFDVCARLRELSNGWPALLNYCALDTIERSTGFPLSLVDGMASRPSREQEVTRVADDDVPESLGCVPPRIVVSRDGKELSTYTFETTKVLIGRSDFSDVLVMDDFVSKLHALLILYPDALVLLDLNSSNGTTVNSVKVRKTILEDGDIITLGHHRLRVENAPEIGDDMQDLLKSPDTLRVKHLTDLRRLRARQELRVATR